MEVFFKFFVVGVLSFDCCKIDLIVFDEVCFFVC